MEPRRPATLRFPLIALFALWPALAPAQFASPEIETIFPPGGMAGTTLEVALTGTDLDDLTGLQFTNPGITAQPVILPADEIWPEPRHADLKFAVQIAANVPPGIHEVRTVGRFGLSTPRLFVVSRAGGPAELTGGASNESLETATAIELEQVVNGRTTQNRSDHYKVSVSKGQRVLVHVWGERLDSRIDAMVSVLDPAGRQVAASLNEIGLDPLGDFTADADGEYTIKVSDYLYNGGPAYYYRLVATTAPYLDGIFPPSGKAGARQKFVLYGRNLPGGQSGGPSTAGGDPLETKEIEIDVPAVGNPVPVNGGKILQGIAESFQWRDGDSNPLRIGIARDDLVVEDPQLDEQVVNPPCEVVGRFDQRGDQDRYRFRATKGASLVIDVIAERMAVAADPILIVQQIVKPAAETEADGAAPKESTKFIAEADDIVLKSLLSPGGFGTRSRDARLLFTAPEDGEYRIVLGNNMNRSGALAPYRLAIHPPRPGFSLIAVQDKNWQENRNAMPGVTRVHAGGTTFIRVLALREAGFDGPIELSVRGLPPGVMAPPVSIWGPNDEGYLVLSAATHAQDWRGELEISGKALIDGKAIDVPALAGTLVWSAQDPARNRTRSRATTQFPLEVSSRPADLALQPAETKIWRVELKKTLEIPVKLTRGKDLKGAVKVTAYGLPGFSRPPSLNVSGNEGVVKIGFNPDGNNKPRASEGSFVFRVDGVRGKHRNNPEGAERWDRWKKAIDARANELNAARSKASSALSTATTARTTAERKLTDHNNAHKKLAQAVEAAQAKAEAAKREAQTADTASHAVPAARLAAVKSAVAANQAARPALEKAAADAKAKAEAASKTSAQAGGALEAEITSVAENEKALLQTVASAEAALKASQDALAAAQKSLAAHLAPRVPLANSAAQEEIRVRLARRSAALAESELTQVIAEHGAKSKALAEAKTKADAALKAPDQVLAKANKATAEKEAAKAALEKTLAETRTKLETAKKTVSETEASITAATAAHQDNLTKLTAAQAEAAAIQQAKDAHKTNLAKLTQAKTQAATDVKNAGAVVTSTSKQIATAEAALVASRKVQGEVQTKYDEAKKAADEAAAAIPAEEKAHAAHLVKLTAAKETTAQALRAIEPVFAAAAKRVADHDAGKKDVLAKAVADAGTKIAPARKAFTEAKAKHRAAKGSRDSVLQKLSAARHSADLARAAAETARVFADQALAENQAAAAALARSLTEAQAAVTAASAPATGDPIPPAKITELSTAAKNAAAKLSGTLAALAKAKQELAAHEAAKPLLEEAASEAIARAEAAKVESERLTELVTRANAARTLAATEARNAQNRAQERDAKFTVFSEPIALRILDPPAPK